MILEVDDDLLCDMDEEVDNLVEEVTSYDQRAERVVRLYLLASKANEVMRAEMDRLTDDGYLFMVSTEDDLLFEPLLDGDKALMVPTEKMVRFAKRQEANTDVV